MPSLFLNKHFKIIIHILVSVCLKPSLFIDNRETLGI